MADNLLSDEDIFGTPRTQVSSKDSGLLSDADIFGGGSPKQESAPFDHKSYAEGVDTLDQLARFTTGPFSYLANKVRGVTTKADESYRADIDKRKLELESLGHNPAVDEHGIPITLDEDGNPTRAVDNPQKFHLFNPLMGLVEGGMQAATGLGSMVSQGIGAIAGALNPNSTAREGAEFGAQLAEPFQYKPVTSGGRTAAAAFEGSLPAISEKAGEGGEEMAQWIPFFNALSPEMQLQIKASAHALGKSIPDMLMVMMMGAHGPQGAARANASFLTGRPKGPTAAEALAKLQELQAKKESPTPAYRETADIFGRDLEGQMMDGSRAYDRAAAIRRMQEEAAQGERRSAEESQQFLRRELTGVDDMFDPALRAPDRGLVEPNRGGGEIPASEFQKFSKEFHNEKAPMTERTRDLFDVDRQPSLLQEHNPEAFKGLDYWKSRLEDENLFFDKAANDPVSKRLDARLQKENEQLRSLQEQMSSINQESVRLKQGEDIVRMKKADQTITDMQQAIGQQIGKINRLEETFRERMAALYPETRSAKGTTFNVHPENAFTGKRGTELNSFNPIKTFEDKAKLGLRDHVAKRSDEVLERHNPGFTNLSKAEQMKILLGDKLPDKNHWSPKSFNPAEILDDPQLKIKIEGVGKNSEHRQEVINNIAEAYGISPEMAEKMLDFLRENDMHRLRTANPAEFVNELIKDKPAFGAFKKALIETYGKDIEPYAKTLYEEAQKHRAQTRSSNPSRQEVLPPEESQGRSPKSDKLKSFISWDRRGGDEMNAFLKSPERPEGDASFSFLKQGQANARRHPIMNWTYDKIDMAERNIVETTNAILYGQKFVERNRNLTNISSLRRAARTADPDSALYQYHQLKDAEKSKLIEVAEKYNGVEEPTAARLAEEGLTPVQIKAYQNLRKGLDKLWDEVITPAAKRLGVELPGKIPGFFPHTWFGDYRVWGKNKETGKTEFVHGVSSMREAKKAIAELSEQFPQFEFKPEEVTNAGREFTGMADAFIDAIRLLGSKSEDGRAMTEAMQEILTRRGYSKHFKAREGILGAAGTFEQGKVNPIMDPNNMGRDKRLVNWERSYENYIKSGVRYAHNKELLADLEKVLNDPDFARDKYPNAVAGSRGMLDAYLGSDRFLDKPMKDLMMNLGLSTHIPENTIRFLASVVMYEKVMMARAPFYMAQAMQDMFTIPRLQQLQGMGLKGNINYALAHGLMDWLDGSNRVAEIQWAVKQGIVEPKFSEQILFLPHLRGGKMNFADNVNLITGNTASAALDQTTRLRSYLTLLNFAESAGLKGKEAMEAAAKSSLDVMVEYEGWKRSPMFREMGTTGGLFSPLTTFTNNLLNRITEYTKEFGAKNAKPILTMAGVYLAIAGVYGMPFRDDIDGLIDTISRVTGVKIPNITDGLISMSNNLPKKTADIVMFGLPSGLSGMQIGGSLGSPEIIGSLVPGTQDPLLKLVQEAVKTLAPLIAHPNSATDAEKMAALKAVSPTAPFHGMIEHSFSPSNQGKPVLDRMLPQDKPVMTPGSNMEGKYLRSPQEQYARMVGVKSTDETLVDMKKYRKTFAETMLTEKRSRALTNLVDGAVNGTGLNVDAVRTYVESGGNFEELDKIFRTKVGNRYTTYQQRELKQAINALEHEGNPRKAKLLQEYGLINERK